MGRWPDTASSNDTNAIEPHTSKRSGAVNRNINPRGRLGVLELPTATQQYKREGCERKSDFPPKGMQVKVQRYNLRLNVLSTHST